MVEVIFRRPTPKELKKHEKQEFVDEYDQAGDRFKRQSSMLQSLNVEVISAFETATKQKWFTVCKDLKRKDAERLAGFLSEAVEFAHGPSDGKRVHFALPPYVGLKRAHALSDLGMDLWADHYHLGEFMRDMSLVYLVSQFKAMLQKFIGNSLYNNPEALSSGRALTLDELRKCGRIQDAIGAVIEKEVADVMQDDIDGVDKYLAGKWGIRISSQSTWTKFRERFYRRNIIVHNSGMTNDMYRRKTHYTGKSVRLGVSEAYLNESVSLFNEAASRLLLHFSSRRSRKK